MSQRSAPATSTYTVRQGDSLWRIAKNHHTTSSVLLELNGLESHDTELWIGQVLKVPHAGPPTAEAVELKEGQVVARVNGSPRLLGPGDPSPAPAITTDGRYVLWLMSLPQRPRTLRVWDASTGQHLSVPVGMTTLERMRVHPTSDHQHAILFEGSVGGGEFPPSPVVAIYSPVTGLAWRCELPATVESVAGDVVTVRYHEAPNGMAPFPGAELEELDLRPLLRG